MSISVVISTYNRAPLLETTLAQLRRQHYDPDDEVVVVDNASTDRTPDVLAEAARRFPVRLCMLRESTPGKTPALVKGIAAARGEILALTDDDVLVADDWIATIRRLFSDSSRQLVGGRVDPLWERPAPRWLHVGGEEQYNQMASPLALLHYGQAQRLGARTAVGANLVVRRTVHDALGGFAAHLGRRRGTLLCGEDHNFCQRAEAAGYRCEYRPELRVQHWVPASRARLRYFVRWFFWSGVTNAMLDGAESGTAPLVPRCLLLRLGLAPFSGLRQALAGQPATAAACLVDASFAAGYIAQNIRGALAKRRSAPPLAQKA